MIILLSSIPLLMAYRAMASPSGISSPLPCPPDIMTKAFGFFFRISIPLSILLASNGGTCSPLMPAPNTII